MAESAPDFYSKGAEEFAKNYSIDGVTEGLIELLDTFTDLVGHGKVLDAGCGHGRDTEYFEKKGLEAIGIDLAEGMLEIAKKRENGNFRKMGIQDMEFEDNKFDGVWCNSVLQFFPPEEMDNVISELDRVNKEDGYLFINFKIGEGDFIREKYGGKVKHHLIPAKEAREKIESKGYKIIETDRVEIEDLKILNMICEKK